MEQTQKNIKPSTEIKKEREFHDAWAFITFVTINAILAIIYIVNTNNIVDTAVKIQSDTNLLWLILGNTAFTVLILIAMVGMCHIVPKPFIIASLILVPLGIMGAIYDASKETGGTFMILGITSIILLIIFGIMAFVILCHFSYVAKVISVAAGIFFFNFPGIVAVWIFCQILLALFTFPVLLVNGIEGNTLLALQILSVIVSLWGCFITRYFLETYTASVIFSEINNDDESVFGTSLKNSAYALGSVSYGALLVALITVLESIIRSARQNERERGQRGSLILIIICWIAEIFVSMLGDIVKLANRLAFPYLSVNGTCYVDSVSQSFSALAQSGMENVASIYGTSFVIFLGFCLSIECIGAWNRYFFFEKLGLSYDSNLVLFVISTIVFDLIFYVIFTLLDSAVISLIYTRIAIPEKLREYDHEFFEVLDEKKKHMEPEPETVQ